MVCVLEIIEVFFIDTLSIILRRRWQKAKTWWHRRHGEQDQEASVPPSEVQGYDNPACTDDDLPTFNTAMRLPLPPEVGRPRTPPPNYNTLALESPFSEQLPDTTEVRTQC